MIPTSRKRRTAALHIAVISIAFSLSGCQKTKPLATPAGSAAQPAPASGSLADALETVQGDEETWGRCCLLAFGVEVGIPEQRLLEAWPGAKLDALPPKVLAALQQGTAGIPAWIQCLHDKRATGILESDIWGGGSSEKAQKISCRQAAMLVLFALAPAGLFDDVPKDEESKVQKLTTVMTEWEKRVHSLSAQERMQAWFALANDGQRLRFLAMVVQSRYAPAYPLLEENFLKRAAKPDDFLGLEVSAYIRHRRDKAAGFLGRIEKWIHIPEKEYGDFFREVWTLLTRYPSLEPAIDDWLAGRIEIGKLNMLLERSIDMPWAYHSMGIEPAAVHRPVMEANLRSLLAAAQREQSLEKRIVLLDLADSATNFLKQVVGRTSEQERRPRPRSDSPEWQETLKQLNELFADNRITAGEETVTTPAEKAAEIVWQLWGPDARSLDGARDNIERDWRTDHLYVSSSLRSLLVEAATACLTNPNDSTPQPFPREEANRLAGAFTTGNATAWRAQMSALPWEQRLLLQGFANVDAEFAVRLWPRLLEFVDWQFAAGTQPPESFNTLWRERLSDKKLDEKTWTELVDWTVAEGKAGRPWRVLAESSVCRPGVSLYVFPSRAEIDSSDSLPKLKTSLRGTPWIMCDSGDFRVTANGLERIDDSKETSFPLPKSPTPIQALTHRSQLPANDREVTIQSFIFEIRYVPAKE